MSAQTLPREQWGAMPVAVTQAEGSWTIQGRQQTVTLTESNLALRVQAGPVTWKMVPSNTNDLRLWSGSQEVTFRLAYALQRTIEPFDAAFKPSESRGSIDANPGSTPPDIY